MISKRRANNIVSALLGSALVLQHAAPVWAAQSVYSVATVANSTPGQITEDLTLTVGLDWDYDGGVKQANSNGAVTLDRDAVKSILNDAATLLYAATESRHLVKKIYVYRNVKDTNYDITLSNSLGRNAVDLAGWGKPSKGNVVTLAHDVVGVVDGAAAITPTATPITNSGISGTVGVEVARGLLSYLYGLASEGPGSGTACGGNPAVACDADAGAMSLLNPAAKTASGATVRRLTTPMDYIQSRFYLTDAEKARLAAAPAVTAQQRVWATSTDFGPDKTFAVGASAWELLARPVAQDPKSALGLGRTAFPALADYDWQKVVPNGTAVPSVLPEIVFVDTPYRKDVVLVNIFYGVQADRDNRIGAVAPLLQAAIDSAGSLSQFALLSTPALEASEGMTNGNGNSEVFCKRGNSTLAVLPQKNPATDMIGAAAQKEFTFAQNKADGSNDAQYKPTAADLQSLYERFAASAKNRVKPGVVPLTCSEDFGKFAYDNAVQYAISVLKSDTTLVDGGFSTLHYITDSEPGLSEETLKQLKQNRIVLNTLVVKPGTETAKPVGARRTAQAYRAGATTAALTPVPAGLLSLAKLAALTGGNSATAKTGAEAAKKMAQSANELQGRASSIIFSSEVDPIAEAATQAINFRLASKNTDKDVGIGLYLDSDDIQKLTPTLRDPQGGVVTLPKAGATAATGTVSGIGYSYKPEEGTYDITLPATLAVRSSGGEWTLSLTADTAMNEALSVEVVSEGGVPLNLNVSGGTLADKRPLVISAELGSGNKKVLGAVLTATVYDREGNAVLENVALTDDGQNGDYQKGDGVYAVNLGGQLPLGDYEVFVEVSLGGSAKLLDGSAAEAFTREASAEFFVEDQTTMTQYAAAADKAAADAAAAAAVAAQAVKDAAAAAAAATAAADAAGTGSNIGGGCSTNPNGRDASLALLVGWALLALGLRRRRSAASKA